MGEYRFTLAAIKAGAKKGASPKDAYVELFQETLNEQFYNASNWYTIEEETEIGSQEYQDVDVRIAHTINSETGLKLGDDWKTLYFKDVGSPPALGRLYRFDDSVWLTINIESGKNLTATCTIRRCNNSLRWVDERTGAYYEEPCIIEYLVKEPRDYLTQGSPFRTPGGFLHINVQFNKRTNLIKENNRFLFGNPGHWTAYRVVGTGINDFRNTKTFDWRETRVLAIDVIADFVNKELDDIVNGIANAGVNDYKIKVSKDSIEGSVGGTFQLRASITYKGHTSEREISWVSSDENIATVDKDGLVTFLSNGECVITANVLGNPAGDECVVLVKDNPSETLDIRVDPSQNYVLEKTTVDFHIYLYKNGVKQTNTFDITCNQNNVPSESFVFTGGSSTNVFSVKNKQRDLDSKLTISCVCNGETISKDIDLYLRGAWLTEAVL